MPALIEPWSEPGAFAHAVVVWQRANGRHDLPWQRTRDPYRIWLSEIMLQQTQVAAVVGYYERFLAAFPTLAALAAAPVDAVMAQWSGLGYYSRARNLHRCAQQLVAEYGGQFPADPEQLVALPGIGRSTAAAIAAFAFGARAAILDGNVKRVFARVFGIDGYPGQRAVEQRMWALAEQLLPNDADAISAYTQGLMDLGATLCTRTRPACGACPLAAGCVAKQTQRTGALPTPKPRKPVPLKRVTVLWCVADDRWLLQRRPAVGIWGGLWSLPECDVDAAALQASPAVLERAVCAALGGAARVRAVETLPAFGHTLTHFRLTIEPVRVELEQAPRAPQSDAMQWLLRADALAAGLPAPIRKLLSG